MKKLLQCIDVQTVECQQETDPFGDEQGMPPINYQQLFQDGSPSPLRQKYDESECKDESSPLARNTLQQTSPSSLVNSCTNPTHSIFSAAYIHNIIAFVVHIDDNIDVFSMFLFHI